MPRFDHLASLVALPLALASLPAAAPPAEVPPAPARLSMTGLWSGRADGSVAPGVHAYAPQYPLWSDGAAKRRWIRLPPGTAIDASDPDRWQFPIGTELWKEFSFGRRVETRYMRRRADGAWTYATYRWNAAGTDAELAPARGLRGVIELAQGVRHDLPSEPDCRACHEAGPVQVLGVTALQLSPDRDPLAPHAEAPPPGAVDLPALVALGLVRGLDPSLLRRPPRIAGPPRARAALGWIHANCGGCHAGQGALAPLGLALAWRVRSPAEAPPGAVATTVGVPSHYRPADLGPAPVRVAAGDPAHSVLLARAASRSPARQMPPLGTKVVDEEAVALLRDWIALDVAAPGTAMVAAPLTPQHPEEQQP